MKFTMIYPSGEGQRFASDAFATEVGKPVRILVNEGTADERIESGVLVEAKISDDGLRAMLTFNGPAGLLGEPTYESLSLLDTDPQGNCGWDMDKGDW